MCPTGGSWRTEIADDQEEISERLRKIIEDCNKSTGRVSLNEQGQGHLIVKIADGYKHVSQLLIAKMLSCQTWQRGTSFVRIEDGELRESSVMIFTSKEENNDEQHNDPKFREGSTHHERPLDTQRLEIDTLRREDVNAQHLLACTKACIKSFQAYLKAHQAYLARTKACKEEYQACMEKHQAFLEAYQAHVADVHCLAADYARLSVANNIESNMS
ncbi:uncharacterized protein FTOL_09022 [Fusarium torulosum]|uniref:Uncharacterized protein n=1 Tax=Fusarium torulosum TaxID=33205 RepID=A0AAE8MFC2_9HYPO|nr:uncharacterized protein FTOL_09022 [Fusarium torulosum]